jgi:hypothetical protein
MGSVQFRLGSFVGCDAWNDPITFIARVGAAGFSATFLGHPCIFALDLYDTQHFEDPTRTLNSYGAEIASTCAFA